MRMDDDDDDDDGIRRVTVLAKRPESLIDAMFN